VGLRKKPPDIQSQAGHIFKQRQVTNWAGVAEKVGKDVAMSGCASFEKGLNASGGTGFCASVSKMPETGTMPEHPQFCGATSNVCGFLGASYDAGNHSRTSSNIGNDVGASTNYVECICSNGNGGYGIEERSSTSICTRTSSNIVYYIGTRGKSVGFCGAYSNCGNCVSARDNVDDDLGVSNSCCNCVIASSSDNIYMEANNNIGDRDETDGNIGTGVGASSKVGDQERSNGGDSVGTSNNGGDYVEAGSNDVDCIGTSGNVDDCSGLSSNAGNCVGASYNVDDGASTISKFCSHVVVSSNVCESVVATSGTRSYNRTSSDSVAHVGASRRTGTFVEVSRNWCDADRTSDGRIGTSSNVEGCVRTLSNCGDGVAAGSNGNERVGANGIIGNSVGTGGMVCDCIEARSTVDDHDVVSVNDVDGVRASSNGADGVLASHSIIGYIGTSCNAGESVGASCNVGNCASATSNIRSHVGASSIFCERVGASSNTISCIRPRSDVSDNVGASRKAGACVGASRNNDNADRTSRGRVGACCNVGGCVGARSNGGDGDDCIGANSIIGDRVETGCDIRGWFCASRNAGDCGGNEGECVAASSTSAECEGRQTGECARCHVGECALTTSNIRSHVGASSNVGKRAVECNCIRAGSDDVGASWQVDACVIAIRDCGDRDRASNGGVGASNNVVGGVEARSNGGDCVEVSSDGEGCKGANNAIGDLVVTGNNVRYCIGASSDVGYRGGASMNNVYCVRASSNDADCVGASSDYVGYIATSNNAGGAGVGTKCNVDDCASASSNILSHVEAKRIVDDHVGASSNASSFIRTSCDISDYVGASLTADACVRAGVVNGSKVGDRAGASCNGAYYAGGASNNDGWCTGAGSDGGDCSVACRFARDSVGSSSNVNNCVGTSSNGGKRVRTCSKVGGYAGQSSDVGVEVRVSNNPRDCAGARDSSCASKTVGNCFGASGNLGDCIGESCNMGDCTSAIRNIRSHAGTSSIIGDRVVASWKADACDGASRSNGDCDRASFGDVGASSNVGASRSIGDVVRASSNGNNRAGANRNVDGYASSNGSDFVAVSSDCDDCFGANSNVGNRVVTGSNARNCVVASSSIVDRGETSKNDGNCVRARSNGADCVGANSNDVGCVGTRSNRCECAIASNNLIGASSNVRSCVGTGSNFSNFVGATRNVGKCVGATSSSDDCEEASSRDDYCVRASSNCGDCPVASSNAGECIGLSSSVGGCDAASSNVGHYVGTSSIGCERRRACSEAGGCARESSYAGVKVRAISNTDNCSQARNVSNRVRTQSRTLLGSAAALRPVNGFAAVSESRSEQEKVLKLGGGSVVIPVSLCMLEFNGSVTESPALSAKVSAPTGLGGQGPLAAASSESGSGSTAASEQERALLTTHHWRLLELCGAKAPSESEHASAVVPNPASESANLKFLESASAWMAISQPNSQSSTIPEFVGGSAEVAALVTRPAKVPESGLVLSEPGRPVTASESVRVAAAVLKPTTEPAVPDSERLPCSRPEPKKYHLSWWQAENLGPDPAGPRDLQSYSHGTQQMFFQKIASTAGPAMFLEAALVRLIEQLLFAGIFFQILVVHHNLAHNFFRRYIFNLSESSVAVRKLTHWSVWFWREVKLLQLALLLLCTVLRAGDTLLDQTLHRLLILSVISNMTDRRLPAKVDAKKFRFGRESPEIEAGVEPAGGAGGSSSGKPSRNFRRNKKQAAEGMGGAAVNEEIVWEEAKRKQEREKSLMETAVRLKQGWIPSLGVACESLSCSFTVSMYWLSPTHSSHQGFPNRSHLTVPSLVSSAQLPFGLVLYTVQPGGAVRKYTLEAEERHLKLIGGSSSDDLCNLYVEITHVLNVASIAFENLQVSFLEIVVSPLATGTVELPADKEIEVTNADLVNITTALDQEMHVPACADIVVPARTMASIVRIVEEGTNLVIESAPTGDPQTNTGVGRCDHGASRKLWDPGRSEELCAEVTGYGLSGGNGPSAMQPCLVDSAVGGTVVATHGSYSREVAHDSKVAGVADGATREIDGDSVAMAGGKLSTLVGGTLVVELSCCTKRTSPLSIPVEDHHKHISAADANTCVQVESATIAGVNIDRIGNNSCRCNDAGAVAEAVPGFEGNGWQVAFGKHTTPPRQASVEYWTIPSNRFAPLGCLDVKDVDISRQLQTAQQQNRKRKQRSRKQRKATGIPSKSKAEVVEYPTVVVQAALLTTAPFQAIFPTIIPGLAMSAGVVQTATTCSMPNGGAAACEIHAAGVHVSVMTALSQVYFPGSTNQKLPTSMPSHHWRAFRRRLACRPSFVFWSQRTFLYRLAKSITDHHRYSPSAITPIFDFRSSQAYVEHRRWLRSKLHWLLMCMQFRRLTLWAKMLLFPHIFDWFLKILKRFGKWRRNQARGTKVTVSVWQDVLVDCVRWALATTLAYVLSQELGNGPTMGLVYLAMLIRDVCLTCMFDDIWSTPALILLYGLLYHMIAPHIPGHHQWHWMILTLHNCMWIKWINYMYLSPDTDLICSAFTRCGTYPIVSWNTASSVWSPDQLSPALAILLLLLLPVCQLLILVWFLLLHSRILPSCGSSLAVLHVKLDVCGSSLGEGLMSGLIAGSDPASEPEDDQTEVALSSSKSPGVQVDAGCQAKLQDIHSLSEMNKLSQLCFAEAIACASLLSEKVMELEGQVADALKRPDSNQQNLMNHLKPMLGTALLMDCLVTKILESADAHGRRTERRPVILQVKKLDSRITPLIWRLESALDIVTPSTLDRVCVGPRSKFVQNDEESSNVWDGVAASSSACVCARANSNVKNSVRVRSNIIDCVGASSKVHDHARQRRNTGGRVMVWSTVGIDVSAGNCVGASNRINGRVGSSNNLIVSSLPDVDAEHKAGSSIGDCIGAMSEAQAAACICACAYTECEIEASPISEVKTCCNTVDSVCVAGEIESGVCFGEGTGIQTKVAAAGGRVGSYASVEDQCKSSNEAEGGIRAGDIVGEWVSGKWKVQTGGSVGACADMAGKVACDQAITLEIESYQAAALSNVMEQATTLSPVLAPERVHWSAAAVEPTTVLAGWLPATNDAIILSGRPVQSTHASLTCTTWEDHTVLIEDITHQEIFA